MKLTRRAFIKLLASSALAMVAPVVVRAEDKPRERNSNLNRNHEVKGRHKHDE